LLESKLLASNEHLEALADHLRLICAASSSSHPPPPRDPPLDSRARALAPSPPLSWRLDIKFASEAKTKILEGEGRGLGREIGGGRDEEQVDRTVPSQGWSLDKMWGEESGEAKKVDVVSDAQREGGREGSALEMTHEQAYNASAAAASEEGHWRKAFDPESGPMRAHTRTHALTYTCTYTHTPAHALTYTHTHIRTYKRTHILTKLN
jgi:hypothetical protein